MASDCDPRDRGEKIQAAISAGDLTALDALEVADYRDRYGAKAAHFAARCGQLIVLQHLRNSARFSAGSAVTGDGHTPLHDAAASGQVSVAKWLCDERLCSPLDADVNGCTPVHFAARFGKLEVFKLFVTQYGSDPLATTKSGMTALHWAACKGRVQIVKFIVRLHQR